jgi:hypothetical protein
MGRAGNGPPFLFAWLPAAVSSRAVRREMVRKFLGVALVLSAAFAAWAWLRPYAWWPDASAHCKVVETLVTRDSSFCWVNVHLKVNSGAAHDLEKPVVLETADGRRFGPADTTMSGENSQDPRDLWFRFWLDREALAGPLTLHVNNGNLAVKSTAGIPEIEDGRFRNFTTHRW